MVFHARTSMLMTLMMSPASGFVRPTSSVLQKKHHMQKSTQLSMSEPLEEPASVRFSQTRTSLDSARSENNPDIAAATNTINERLLAELQQATEKEQFGSRSEFSETLGLTRRDKRSDDEIKASIAQARDLNGVNPLVTTVGGIVALAMAAALWTLTQYLGDFFVSHPLDSDAIYFVQRVTSVFRNMVMGLASLASGFFGVTGVGILALGVRVAFGVAKGELDPTPLPTKVGDEIELPNVWELMMGGNKRKGRR